MKFVKSISLILLFAIFGINGVFAQNDDSNSNGQTSNSLENKDDRIVPNEDYFPYPSYTYLNIEKQHITFYQPTFKEQVEQLAEEQWIADYILQDAYITVFGSFGGTSEFFDQYPYDTDFPEWMGYAYICNSSFWETLSSKRRHGDQLATILTQAYTASCSSDFNSESYRIFSLIHPKSKNQDEQDEIEAFVIPLKGIRIPRDILEVVISRAQDLIDDKSREYVTALQIRDLIYNRVSGLCGQLLDYYTKYPDNYRNNSQNSHKKLFCEEFRDDDEQKL